LERFSEFTEELDPQTRQMLERGKRMRELLKQEDLIPLSFEKEIAVIFAGTKGYLDDLPLEKIQQFKKDLIEELSAPSLDILDTIREKEQLDSKTEGELEVVIKRVKKSYGA
jgi:F-type H+-transporting ATPase subunit alpha